eukprot:jgi/Psemu1/323712/estExt_fgenesh1_pg.C_900020
MPLLSSSISDDSIAVRTTLGRPYSVERYYMLSEIEQHSLQPVYLDDHDCCDDSKGGDNDNENERDNECDNECDNDDEIIDSNRPGTETQTAPGTGCNDPIAFPPFVILYLVWYSNPDDAETNRTEAMLSFLEGPVRAAIQKLKRLWKRARVSPHDGRLPSPMPSVYVVIDVLVTPSPEAKQNDHSRTEEFRTQHVPIAEELAKGILSLSLSSPNGNESSGTEPPGERRHDEDVPSPSLPGIDTDLAGVTVGLTDHPRAAPGLESCLEAISVGSRDRRKYGSIRGDGSIHKSCIGIVCNSIRDLVGFDEEGETDAVQGVMQSRTEASRHHNDPGTGTAEGEAPVPALALALTHTHTLSHFANEAHRHWRVHTAGWTPNPTPEEEEQQQRSDAGFDSYDTASSLVWIAAIAIAVASWFWKFPTE